MGSTSITNFTKPSESFGYTISRVNFNYKVVNLPGWVKTPELMGRFSILKELVSSKDSGIDDTAVVILTEKGWIHEKIYKK